MERIVESDENLLSGTVHRNVVVAVRTREYRRVSAHLKTAVDLAWRSLTRGRMIYRVITGDEAIFLLCLDPEARQVGAILDEEALAEAFLDAGGVGRVTVDDYELKLARKLAEKFGTRVQ